MPLVATCQDCGKDYQFSALQKAQQNGFCPACNKQHRINQLKDQISADKSQMEALHPEVCKLHTRKRRLETAYYKALSAWENKAKVHAALDRRLALNQHELKELQAPPKEATKTRRQSTNPADQAKKALESLPADVRAALIAQLKGAK